MLLERVDPHLLQESKEKSEALRSITRDWKRLLRIKEASPTKPSLGQPKRRVQEILKDDDDLVPLKKRCASVKSIEMAKAVD